MSKQGTMKNRSGSSDGQLLAKPSAMNMKDSFSSRPVVTMGWHPDIPDCRDWLISDDKIQATLKDTNTSLHGSGGIPDLVDHRRNCPAVEDQGSLGSCTAQAVVGLMEYMMKMGMTEHMEGSRLFVYKVTRRLQGTTGDSGAHLRTAMQAVALFGIPPEKHWPYITENYENEPDAFLYAYASNYQALRYVRLDPRSLSPDEILDQIKRVLASGFCVVFGFSVYSSLTWSANIPFPKEDDTLRGGHAVMAVGYDDNHEYEGNNVPSLIIRNSWGPSWGDSGYGYLPYDYVLAGLARDFWTCFKWEWINNAYFK